MAAVRHLALALAWTLACALSAQPSTGSTDAADPDRPQVYSRILIRSEKLAPGSRLGVKNRNGDVVVVGWEKEEVHLIAEIRDTERRRVEVEVESRDGGLDIEAVFQQPFWSFDWGLVQTPRCEMTIFVPQKLSGFFKTTNGSVLVSYLDGYARCETNNGDIEVKHLTGEANVETRNGTIQCQDLNARLRALTTNGQVILVEVMGGITARTTNGDISARMLDGWGEGITLATDNGSIDVSLGEAAGEITVQSADGHLDLRLPSARILDASRQSARLRVSGRAQKITLSTSHGNITLRE